MLLNIALGIIGLLGLGWLAFYLDSRPTAARRVAGIVAITLLSFLLFSIANGDFLSRSPNQDDPTETGSGEAR